MANKAQLIEKVADKTGFTKKDATAAVSATLEAIQDFLTQGEDVRLVDFGAFIVRNRAARKGRNPQTGEAIDIPASKVPVFKAGKGFKEAVK